MYASSHLYPVSIKARDIPDAWFQCIDAILDKGRQTIVDHGSYEGQKRWELDFVQIQIAHPHFRPLVPEMPPHLSEIPSPAVMTAYEEKETGTLSVENYLPYLITPAPPKPNEAYTYGERIYDQMESIICRYKYHGFGSNQECISVSEPKDIHLEDPPCLRMIDTRIFKGAGVAHLHFYVYFRSWALWGGFPLNLAAIHLMQEYMAGSIGVETGEIIALSKGLHLYDHEWDIAKIRTGRRSV